MRETKCDSRGDISFSIGSIHRLNIKMLKGQGLKILWRQALLRIDQFNSAPRSPAKVPGFRTHAKPIDAGRRRNRAIAFHRNEEILGMGRVDQRRSSCSSGSPPVKTTKRSPLPAPQTSASRRARRPRQRICRRRRHPRRQNPCRRMCRSHRADLPRGRSTDCSPRTGRTRRRVRSGRPRLAGS